MSVTDPPRTLPATPGDGRPPAIAAPPTLAGTPILLAQGPFPPASRLIDLLCQEGRYTVALAAGEDAVRVGRATGARLALIDFADLEAGRQLAGLLAERMPEVPRVGLWPAARADELPALLGADVLGLITHDAAPADVHHVLTRALDGCAGLSSELVARVLSGAREALRGADPDDAAALERARHAFLRPGALRSLFRPIGDLRDQRTLGYLHRSELDLDDDGGWDDDAIRRHGLGAELEVTILREALTHVPRLPPDALMFLRCSASTIVDGALEELFPEQLGSRVVIEIADHPGPDRIDVFLDAVARLRRRGLQFAVDETGVGFGSLEHVLELAPSFVRLPAGLVRDVDADRTRRALAMAVMLFASHLGAAVIAEDLWTSDELGVLRRMGVHYGAGDCIGPPAPLPGLEAEAEVAGGPVEPATDTLLRPPATAPAHVLRLLSARAASDFGEAAKTLLGVLAEELPASTVYITHHDEWEGRQRVVDVRGRACPVVRGSSVPLEQALATHVLAGEAPQLVVDARREPALAALEPCERLNVRSFLCMPLHLADGTLLGTLEAAAPEADRFSVADLHRLRDMAPALVRALHGAHRGEEQIQLIEAVRAHSWSDGHTNLLNRPRFEELLHETNARASHGSMSAYLVVASLHNGEALSRQMGQAFGDLLVKDTARGLERLARQGDLCARIAPYRFGAILLARTEPEAAYFTFNLNEQVLASARRRSATPDLRVSHRELGRGDCADDVLRLVTEACDGARRANVSSPSARA